MRAGFLTEICCKKTFAGCIAIWAGCGHAGKERDRHMVINGVNGAGGAGMQAIGRGQAEDAVSKRLMQQIEDAQKKLQEISGNSEMSVEDKMKMRQEIQKEISELNSQLRQHQMDLHKKEAEEAKKKQAENASTAERPDNSRARNANNGQVDVQLSAEGMQAILSADGAMKQAKVQGSVANAMEGRAGVLEAEIKLDSARNGDTSAKEAQLADVKQKAQDAVSAQMSTLAEADEALKEANKTAGNADETKKEETDEKKEQDGQKADDSVSENGNDNEGNVVSGAAYTPVDVRL